MLPQAFRRHQATFDPPVRHGWQYCFRSCALGPFTDEVIDPADLFHLNQNIVPA